MISTPEYSWTYMKGLGQCVELGAELGLLTPKNVRSAFSFLKRGRKTISPSRMMVFEKQYYLLTPYFI